MDILFSTPTFPSDPHTGTLSLLAERLHQRGHNVTGIQEPGGINAGTYSITELSAPDISSPWWINLWHYYRQWSKSVEEYLRRRCPDVVVSDRRTHVPTLQGALKSGTPVVGIVEGLGFMRFAPKQLGPDKQPSFPTLPISSKLQYPAIWSLHRQQSAAFPKFEAVVSLSKFLKDTISHTFGVDSTLIPTAIDLEHVTAASNEPRYVTMVNPRSELKGGDIFLDVARELPTVEFLVAGEFASGDNRAEAEHLTNVKSLGWVDDMAQVYRQTSVLMVPSLVEEGGPRVICEAFANGIPVVGTDRGGIPGFIGDAGAIVEDPHDISQWSNKIRETLRNRDRLGKRAHDSSTRFDIATATKRYERLLENVVDGV